MRRPRGEGRAGFKSKSNNGLRQQGKDTGLRFPKLVRGWGRAEDSGCGFLLAPKEGAPRLSYQFTQRLAEDHKAVSSQTSQTGIRLFITGVYKPSRTIHILLREKNSSLFIRCDFQKWTSTFRPIYSIKGSKCGY